MRYRKNTLITMILLISASVMVSLYYAKKEQIKKDITLDLTIAVTTLPLSIDPRADLPVFGQPELPPSVELLPVVNQPELPPEVDPGVSMVELISNPGLIEEATVVLAATIEVKEKPTLNDLNELVYDMKSRRASGNGQMLHLEPETLLMVAKLEQEWGEQLDIRWAYRGKDLNDKVGGVEHSQHLKGKAVDVVHNGWSKDKMTKFVKLAYDVGFRGFGLGPTIVHLDSRDSLGTWLYPGSPYPLAKELLQ
jgi:uncharacterized protein YcbK (DUF882 family)